MGNKTINNDTQRTNNIPNHAATCGINTKLLMRNGLSTILATAMMFENMMPYDDGGSRGSKYYPPTQRELDKSKGILVHNKQHLHTFTVHGVEIQAPNLKAAKKIYNRTKSK